MVALLVIAPLVWLTMLEVGYVLAYSACADGTNNWLHKTNVALAGISVAAAGTGWWTYRRFQSAGPPVGFLAALAFLVAGLTLIVVIASAIPAFILHPCD
ncbi:MAG TPA: hypothetical protein VEA16_23405 [Vicinamibacterales bacterium]|nr:hypothetical protein [Vicinamibacterales bacterium]